MAHASQAANQAPASSTTSHDNTKAPCNAKWSTSDDTALVNTLKTYASGNSADNGTFKSVAFTATAKALEHSHEASGDGRMAIVTAAAKTAVAIAATFFLWWWDNDLKAFKDFLFF
ncbi:hypothetical protein F5J12DRAFT_786312 [Pisolithus orientalis]|uniref:uncharacterized protein n=1 Tax=Pisolithus orientalis TaxID=936130 RepID=UPI002225580D|nr:uncharacterized protein F5J12DRAFT_786312 [Pisolithus orientalis]KAI5991666.1 hypothetical protein F5J12DRAFT_786312 [Pisolithus orientalis]